MLRVITADVFEVVGLDGLTDPRPPSSATRRRTGGTHRRGMPGWLCPAGDLLVPPAGVALPPWQECGPDAPRP